MSEAAFKYRHLRQLEKQGWYVINLIQTNKNGIPDTLCLKLGEAPYFIEFKAKGKKPGLVQLFRHQEIKQKTGIDTLIMTEP